MCDGAKTVSISENVREPAFCRDGDDFFKFFGYLMNDEESTLRGMSNDRTATVLAVGDIRTLLHEYLALVLRGDIEPYEVNFACKEDELTFKDEFSRMVMKETTRMIQSGVPMEETEDGKLKIKYDECGR